MSGTRAIASILLLLALGFLAALPAQAQERLQLVATTGMIADVLGELGGDQVEVQGLMGSGTDPHLYRQTRNDVTAMTRADAVFWNGLYLEAQLEDFLARLAQRKSVFTLGESVPVEARLADEEYTDQYDPHVWMDPGRWRHVVLAIRDALVELVPVHKAAFTERADAYLSELDALNAYAHEVLATLPEGNRVLITAHDAFGYFGDAYDVEVLGIQGFSTDSEAGLARIETMVDVLVERDIGAIFIETSVSDRNIRALVEGAAARGHEVRIAGELFSDAMGERGTYEGTWLGMLDHNVTLIARSLGGEVPEGGRLGRLAAKGEDE
ncbi:metal ABC transporter solute-binding protein, Zn/Mn family [Halomonas sp.]|uniref:metal ABC transporter solute-binding protein, Zn/Mn family n=1 Tax=Halomonas sp. TaxID=1486246 RepID=UPI0035661DF8